MGDRVLMQCHSSKTGDFGPVLYCHWVGDRATKIVEALRERMKQRPDDVEYSSARLAQIAMGMDDDCLSFGLWNANGLLTAEDSHGDAGCVLIDVSDNHSAKYLGGYLA